MKLNRAEMKKRANPITHAFNRESYFTRIRFKIDNNLVNVTTKIDTGATYTVPLILLFSILSLKGFI